MSDLKHLQRQGKVQRILLAAWSVDLITVLFAILYPISIGITRLLLVVAVPSLWLLTVALLRRRRPFAIAVAALGILFVVFLALPGGKVDPTKLRAEYVRQLREFEGTPYVWGGENGFGIDCSGLVRRGLINANLRVALTSASPQAMRAALDLWWHDCTARALRDQYRSLTALVVTAESINSIADSRLLPGDIAVTANGVHVLAYLGGDEWIQAEPGLRKVTTLSAPNENGWFNKPVHIMRWSSLTEAANPP